MILRVFSNALISFSALRILASRSSPWRCISSRSWAAYNIKIDYTPTKATNCTMIILLWLKIWGPEILNFHENWYSQISSHNLFMTINLLDVVESWKETLLMCPLNPRNPTLSCGIWPGDIKGHIKGWHRHQRAVPQGWHQCLWSLQEIHVDYAAQWSLSFETHHKERETPQRERKRDRIEWEQEREIGGQETISSDMTITIPLWSTTGLGCILLYDYSIMIIISAVCASFKLV